MTFPASLKSQDGQALVEFALIVPALVLLLFGIIEFGRFFNQTLILTSAAREGVRLAAVGSGNDEVTRAVKECAASIDKGSLAVSIVPPARIEGQPITVTVTNPLEFVTPLISTFFKSDKLSLKGQATMRAE